jgi:hypothetical protein
VVSDCVASPASLSGAWKSGEKSCFQGGDLGRDLICYVKPLFFSMLRGSMGLETGLRS